MPLELTSEETINIKEAHELEAKLASVTKQHQELMEKLLGGICQKVILSKNVEQHEELINLLPSCFERYEIRTSLLHLQEKASKKKK